MQSGNMVNYRGTFLNLFVKALVGKKKKKKCMELVCSMAPPEVKGHVKSLHGDAFL